MATPSFSSTESSSSSRQDSLNLTDAIPYLQNSQEEDSKKNWTKIIALAIAIIGALTAGLGALCWMGIFPNTLVGGKIGMWICLYAGVAIVLPAAYVAWNNWSNK